MEFKKDKDSNGFKDGYGWIWTEFDPTLDLRHLSLEELKPLRDIFKHGLSKVAAQQDTSNWEASKSPWIR